MKIIPIAGALGAVAVIFYCAYTRTYDAVGLVILLVFFTYFLNLKVGGLRGAEALSPARRVATNAPIRELGKGLGCLGGGALGVVVGLGIPEVQLGVAVALTAAVVGIVAFMLFVLRALGVAIGQG